MTPTRINGALSPQAWPLSQLHPAPEPLRRNDHAVERMVRTLQEFGWRVPLLVRSDGEIVDGHLRFKAAQTLGQDTVPVLVVDDLADDQIRALRLVLNRSATWATWDNAALLRELSALQLADFDLSLTGFDPRELDAALLSLGGDDDALDVIPDPDDTTVHPGDLWQLGSHRLLCGDATCAEDVATLLDNKPADMIWTDPPYNVNYSGKAGTIRNDNLPAEQFEAFLQASFATMQQAVIAGGAIYVAHADNYGITFRRAMMEAGFKLSACLIWRKNAAVIGRGDYHHQHEPILYGWKIGAPHRWYGDRKQKTIQDGIPGAVPLADGSWQIIADDRVYRISGQDLRVDEIPSTIINHPRPNRSDLHPTTKPVGLIAGMVANSSPKGGVVFDPFGGSGSTLMACEILGRSCRTLELDPRYAAVILKRWQTHTGQEPVLLSVDRDRDHQTEQEEDNHHG